MGSIVSVGPAFESEESPGREEDFSPTFEDQLENEMEPTVADGFQAMSKTPSPPSSSTSPPPPSGKGVCIADYLLCHGKWVHKASICHILFNEGFTAKSHDRLLRVHGFTPVNKHSEVSSPSSPESLFIVGNPFVTLIWANDSTALALVHSTRIQENGISRDDISLKTLEVNGAKMKVTGSILILHPYVIEPAEPEARSQLAWVWNGAYLKTDSPIPGLEGMTTDKVVEVTTLGLLIELVNPSIVDASAYLPAENMAEINSWGITWLLKDEILSTAVDLIWKRALEMKIPLSNFTLIRVTGEMSEQFPYHSTDGT